MGFDFGETTKGILGFQNGVSSIGSTAINFDCFVDDEHTSSFWVECAFFLCLPLAVPLFSVACVTLYWVYKGRDVSTMHAKDLVIACTTFLLFLVHPSVTRACFSNFACKRLGSRDHDTFLALDLSRRCWDGSHLMMVWLVSVPTLLLWVIGVPVAYGYLLVHNRRKIGISGMHGARMRLKYGMLFKVLTSRTLLLCKALYVRPSRVFINFSHTPLGLSSGVLFL